MNDVDSYVAELERRSQPTPEAGSLPRSSVDLDARVPADLAGPGSPLPGFPQPLFGNQAPAYDIKHERPEHRVITFLKAQGLSNREIAQRIGFTPTAVGYILKQPWARARLLQEIESAGRDGVNELLKGAVDDCVLTLIDIQGDDKAKTSDRIAASNSILDRFFGKPTQRVESINTNITTKLSDVDKLRKEAAEVDAELARLTGGTRN